MDQAASLRVPGLQTSVPAKVTVLSPALDPNSTTVEVWVEADNPRGELKPGTTVDVSITTRTVPDALAIPASAVLTESDGQTSVMVVKADSRAYSQKVKTGIQQGATIQIVSGIQSGQQCNCQWTVWASRQDESEGHTHQSHLWSGKLHMHRPAYGEYSLQRDRRRPPGLRLDLKKALLRI